MDGCGKRFFQPNRREFLTVGALGALGVNLADLLAAEAAAQAKPAGKQGAAAEPKPVEAKAKGIIHIYLPGGIAHQESFDPKPYAPLEYRGALGTVSTKIPGVVFCETMPKTAAIVDKITVIRSMTHSEAAHERGTHTMFTGYRPSPALVYPSLGSVVSHELGPRENLPPYVCIPQEPTPYAGPGYLSSSCGPLTPKDTFDQRAYSLVSSPTARQAFDIDAEPAAIRDEYGRNAAGQRMLLARRLIQAGVRVVALSYGSWDFHVAIAQGTKQQMPPLDQAFAALVRDLDRTGLLDSTLVMLSSEFGRTPKINNDAGRDHWPCVFSVVLAGGGVKRGLVYGASTATAAEPESEPIGPADLLATVYHLLGIPSAKKLLAPGNRPIDIVREATVRHDLLA